MGCTASKLDNEDTVKRCRERRRLMKAAVYARHHLSAAHSDYCRSLRATGSALVTFASGEFLSVSDHIPAAELPTFIPPPSPSVHPPPMSTSSHHHQKVQKPPPPRRRNPIKLPHILSDSSFSSSPPPNHNFTYNARANSSYSPSQTSSVWDWDNFYPPSPPDSEYFQKLQNHQKNETLTHTNNSDDDDLDHPYSDNASTTTTSYSNNHGKFHQNPNSEKLGQNLKTWESEEDDETEREEVHCNEWGDHDNYSITSCSSSDEDDKADPKSRPGSENSEPAKNESAANLRNQKSNPKSSSKSEDGKSSVNWGNADFKRMNSGMKIVLRHRDLAEIVEALREYFDRAAMAGEQVSVMLEAGRAQLDRSFKQLRKTIYHSGGMLSNLSSSWTSKPPLTVKYRFEPNSIEQSGGPKSLCSTLERLLAWEKKLYQEIKAREGVKIEHEKKLSVLQSQECRGDDRAKMDKTKASIKRLQSLMLVTSQAVSTTSFAIVGLRDSDLVPQLVELCHGLMYMWRSMNQYHEMQNTIVQQVRGLVNRKTKKAESTTDRHLQATRDLDSSISAWHSSFCRLIKSQRDFIRSLHAWFKLTLIPVNNNEPTNKQSSLPEVFAFFDEWKLASERVPDTVASEAIKSFNNVVRSISLKQADEIKIKKRAEIASKELEKRASNLRSIEKKYYHSFSMVGVGVPDNGHVMDSGDPLAEKKAELATCRRKVEEEMVKHSKAVEVTRAMTLNNIQTGLPGVFQAMTSFSGLITEALETVCTRSYAI
ncbi:hypothetical protein CASFOL_041187 [Castilleja foliolosa]|uniref:Uncharacterized protein n=1 Tax=Castilleja foliolosa TaxID=1961234 RepID=A0ABD3BEN7_9LAMI